MRGRGLIGFAIMTVVLPLLLAPTGSWADWPTYRCDPARNGASPDGLGTPLHLQWTYVPRHAPEPAWPEPGRELHRMPFDYAFQVAVADGTVYFGSSADHKVCALDLATGRERWTFFTEGPVRFAPAVEGERVFVASDDGCLYCLSAADGKLLWKFRGGPRDERLMGNQRLISRWPLRSGVAVADGAVYFSAGMWPGEGVYVYALRAEDGTVVWKNDTSGYMYLPQPHPPSQAMTGVTPQGYIVLHEDQLFIPTGRNAPAAFDRETGELQYYHSRPATWGDRWGGSYVFAAGALLWNRRAHTGPDIEVKLGESDPWPNDGLVAFNRGDGSAKLNLLGKHRAVGAGDVLYASGSGNVTAFDLQALLGGTKPEECKKWDAPHERAYELILAGSTLVAGGRGTVTAIDAADGQALWQNEVDGEAHGLAVSDGLLVVSTDTGQIACFGPNPVATPAEISPAALTGALDDEAAREIAEEILHETGITAGLCLDLTGHERLAAALAANSDLRIYCAEADPVLAVSRRRLLDQAGLNAVRVTIHEIAAGKLPYADYFADLVLVGEDDLEGWPADEVYRVLRPLGGTLVVLPAGAGASAKPQRWLKRGGVPSAEIREAGESIIVVRGKLPGAGEWTHQYADAGRSGCSNDQMAKLPLGLLWFGEPGPAPLVSRHWKGPAPLSIDGRLFVIGQHSVIAVDAYNGRQLWAKDLPGAGRFPVASKGGNAAADAEHVYVATGGSCVQIDAATGEAKQNYKLPGIDAEAAADPKNAPFWDHLAVTGDLVIGTVGIGPESRQLFALGKQDGEVRWLYEARQAVHHDAVAVSDGAVYLIDRTSRAELDRMKRRGERPIVEEMLVALDAETGETLWTTDRALAKREELRFAKGVLLATGGGRMTAYAAADGKMLSWSGVPMRGFPVIVGDTIYGEPRAYDLQTGEAKVREHPLTGEKVPWVFARSYGCGAVSASRNMLLFRSGAVGFCDLAEDSGTHNFGGVRAGCYVNAIVANGLVFMPPADAGCTCSYSYQTTVALAPTTGNEEWSVFTAQQVAESQPVRHVALNLGAVGDRRADDGTLWLSLPRPPTGQALQAPVTVEIQPNGGYYRHNADEPAVEGSSNPWLYASGCEGVQSVTVNVGPGESRSFAVRLHFAEMADLEPGERVFEVKVQGAPVAESLDIVKEAEGARRVLLKEVKGVRANGILEIELASGAGRLPIMSALEIHEE